MTTPSELKKAELARLRDMDIEPQKIIVRDGVPIAFIGEDAALRIIRTQRKGEYLITGRFIEQRTRAVPDTGIILPVFVALDNSDGCCWVEEYFHETIAINWVLGKGDTDRLHLRDIGRLDSYEGLEPLVPLGDESRRDERLALMRWLRKQAHLYGGTS